MISREDAVEILRDVIDSNVLKEKYEGGLDLIARAIEEEMEGRHIWGSKNDDWIELHVAHRADEWKEELDRHLARIDRKYRFTPAPYETGDLSQAEAEDADV